MVEYRNGDLFSANTEAVVNSVNCVGVMGRGIALQFKCAFPDNFAAYAAACKRGEVRPGSMFIVPTGQLTNPRYIVNFPTKRHWRGKSRLEDIEAGLASLVSEIRARGIRSIAIPPLGCNLGGLAWPVVKARMQAALEPLDDVAVVIFAPGSGPTDQRVNRSRAAPSMTPGRAALVGLMSRYFSSLLDPFLTLLEVHKLMYFMQAAGEPLKLRFSKAPQGPYADNLRHVLHAIEGHFVTGYADGGDAPDKQLELVPGAVDDARRFLAGRPATRARFERVADLVEGFESAFGLELLATVHWVGKHEGPRSIRDVIESTYAWDVGKSRFSERQLRLAIDVLTLKGWMANLRASDSGDR